MSFPTFEQADRQMRDAVAKIAISWKHVHHFNLNFGDTIKRRWTKKTRKSKQVLLLQAFPNMAKEHNPEFRALLANDSQSQAHYDGRIDEDIILWPFLNLDDLSRPKPLLSLLDARSQHHPGIFVAQDARALIFGHAADVLHKTYLHGYQMQFERHGDLQAYAVLEPYTEEEAGDPYQNLFGMLPGEGLYVLKIQDRVLSFLETLCGLILHDLDALPATFHLVPTHSTICSVESTCSQAIGSGERLSLAEIAADAAYQAPTSVSLCVLESLVRARLEAAQDHAWDLRQDPAYYSDTVTQATTHFKGSGPNNAGLRNGTHTEWWLAIWQTVTEAYTCVAL